MPFSRLNFQVCSLSTIMREFTAMHSVASLPFKDLILLATEKHKDGDDQSRAWNVPEPLMDYLKTNLNDSQLEAVNVSILCDFCIVGVCIAFLIFI
jgi:senataxin